jgi:molecular chaperone GrpE
MVKANKGNGDAGRLDLEHELPQSDDESVAEAAAPESSQARSSVSQPESEVDRLRSENAGYLDRLARLQAEFDNFRKRSQREQQEFRDYALADALRQVLPLLDSLDRALKTENASTDDFRAGVELIDRQFHDVLTKLGVEPISAAGQEFDPNLHQAVHMVESDSVPDNHVVDELQRGYRIKDRLLRPAMVRVAQNSKR